MFIRSKSVFLSCVAFLILLFSSLTSSNTLDLLLQQAESYKAKGRYLEALSFYNDIYMNKWSQEFSVPLYMGLAGLYYGYLGNADKALKLYRTILQKLPDDPRLAPVYHNSAKIYFKKGEREQALKYYGDVLAKFPDYFEKNNLNAELEALEKGGSLRDDVILSVERPFPNYIRVLVQETAEPLTISSQGGLGLYCPSSSFFRKIPARKAVRLGLRNGNIYLEGSKSFNGPVRIKAVEQAPIKINGRSYRGFLRVYGRDGRLLVVNHVGLEEYLYGVLPLEISPSWPEPALKAQAVAARTYALYHMAKRENEIYDVFSTTSSQVFGGKDAERRATVKAVDMTRGLVLGYDKKIALTLYHANSGGETEKAENVWGSPLPYLSSIRDEFSMNKPGFDWEKNIALDELQQRMQQFGLPAGALQAIEPLERAVSGRIKKLKISQADQSFYLSGNSFRLIVGPGKVKSANFEVRRKKNKFVFKGKGYGHGVGMSQWGAYGMAKAGYDYKKILQFYYQGTHVHSLIN